MWIAVAGVWILGSAVFYAFMVRSAKVDENDICSQCKKQGCEDCESYTSAEEPLRKAA